MGQRSSFFLSICSHSEWSPWELHLRPLTGSWRSLLSLIVHRPSSQSLLCATEMICLSTPLRISWDVESSGHLVIDDRFQFMSPRDISTTCLRVKETRRCGSRLKKPPNDFIFLTWYAESIYFKTATQQLAPILGLNLCFLGDPILAPQFH